MIWKNTLGQFYIKCQVAIDDNAGNVIKAKPLLSNAAEELLNSKNVSISITESFR